MKNKVELIGRVGQEPTHKTASTGKRYVLVSVATSTYRKEKDGSIKEFTQWHQVIFWEKEIDFIAHNVHKGTMVEISGSLQYRSYEDEKGVKRYITEIVGKSVKLSDQE